MPFRNACWRTRYICYRVNWMPHEQFRLRSEVDAGLGALRQADFIELDQDEMPKTDKEDRAWLEAEPVGIDLL